MDGAQVSVFEERDEVLLAGFLYREERRALEPEVTFKVVGDLADESLEWQLADEEAGAFLVATDLTECDCSRSVALCFLNAASAWGGLAGCLGCELLAWSFSACGLSGSLLGSGHAA
jgi:hypothetical protein